MVSSEIQEKAKLTMRNKYNSNCYITSQEYKNKMLNIYGHDNPFKSEKVQANIKITNMDKYGCAYPMQNNEVKEKAKQTGLINWGVSNPMKHPEVKEISLRKNWEHTWHKYQTSEKLKKVAIPNFDLKDYKGSNELYSFICPTCNNEFYSYVGGYINGGSLPRCPICRPILSGESQYEKEIYDWLKSIGIIDIEQHNRELIKPYELDLYLPQHKLAIEFNGLAYHSEVGVYKIKKETSVTKRNIHLHKTNLCEKNGIRLIHIFEDEWMNKPEIIKSIIKNSLGIFDSRIFARNCTVDYINSKDCLDFLFENHLNEPIVRKYNFGLFYDNKLVYVFSLGKPRYNKKYQFEVVRSCCKINTIVIGGFSKLIAYAVKQLNIESIISYVDKRYFIGSGYGKWNFVRCTPPTFNYVSPNHDKRINREHFQKHKLKKLFPEHYSNDLTEWQIMQLAGYDRIWDCGNLVFEYKK